MMTTTSPFSTARSTPFSTWFWPKCLWMPRASTTVSPLSRMDGPSDCIIGNGHIALNGRARPVGLEAVLDQTPERRQNEVVQRRHDEDLEHLELYLHQQFRAPQKLLHRDDRGQRRGLHQAVERVAQRRNDDPHGLRHDDDAHRLRPGHSDRARGFELALRYRGNA